MIRGEQRPTFRSAAVERVKNGNTFRRGGDLQIERFFIKTAIRRELGVRDKACDAGTIL